MKTKEEAIEFARKYLADRKEGYATVPVKLLVILGTGPHEAEKVQEAITRAWDVCVEYILLDIIPYLYGDALD